MDFRERVPLGMTGQMVSRIGLASGYGFIFLEAPHQYWGGLFSS